MPSPFFVPYLMLYEQTIAPVLFEQVLADCEWVAVPDQVCGGPTTVAATMVTFCDGLKP